MESYFYVKERRRFGRHYNFYRNNSVIAHFPPNRALQREFILRDPIDRSLQNISRTAVHSLNTDNVEYKSRGVNHTEGGWPKDVNCMDEEQTIRQRKKIERDEQYSIQFMAQSKVGFYNLFKGLGNML